jgi:5-methylcytosine-specific restriction endonuclease McrA
MIVQETKQMRYEKERINRRRRKTKQWIKDAVAYWESRVYEGDIGCDWDEADVRCWRCGYLRACQKCHIVPRSLGGGDEVDNILPLCADCHDEMPNVADSTEVWKWIAADHGELHDTYWTCRAIKHSGLTLGEIACFDAEKLTRIMGEVSHHFGQLHGRARLSVATLAWAIKRSCSK